MKTKKGVKGTVKHFVSRRKVLRDLKISLPNFNRLCVWKNVYPVLPKSMKKAGKGDCTSRLYYNKNDIKLIESDPIFDTLRKLRAHRMKLKKAIARRDRDSVKKLLASRPKYSLSPLVAERYETWEMALTKINWSIDTLMLLRKFASMRNVSNKLIQVADQLCLQWLHVIIKVKGVRGVFWTNKNTLLIQSEILPGVKNLWSIPMGPMVIPKDFDVKLFMTHAEFAICHVRNVVKNLYEHLGIVYPYQLETGDVYLGEETQEDLLASLAFDLKSTNPTGEIDEAKRKEEMELRIIDADDVKQAEYIEKMYKIQDLFKGKKVYLSEDVQKEIFTFLVRSCGGEVSWSPVFEFAKFPELDESINYQITSKVSRSKNSIFRNYVTPMWIVQSINAGRLLPCDDFVPGGPVIPNICPFAESEYVTKESLYLKSEITADQLYEVSDSEDDADEVVEDAKSDEGEAEYMSDEDDADAADLREVVAGRKTFDELDTKSQYKSKTKVSEKVLEEKMERLNQEMNIPKKRKRLYNKIVHAEKQKKKEVNLLQTKRKAFDKAKKRVNK